jgi:hypothetical protein
VNSGGTVLTVMEADKSMAAEQINALITGSISVQAGYAAVQAELRRFPGGLVLGQALEIGRLTDVAAIAQAIAYTFMPLVENQQPATLVFAFEGEPPASFQLSVDDASISVLPADYVLPAGRHLVSVEAPGYRTESLALDLAPGEHYRIQVRMQEETLAAISLSLKQQSTGMFLINGVTENNPTEGLFVKGMPLLGRFEPEVTEAAEETGETAAAAHSGYFVVPGNTAGKNEWSVAPLTLDVSARVEQKRRAMYFSYSMLMLSLPVWYIAQGESDKLAFTAERNAESIIWQSASYASLGASIASGAWFLWQLVQYLRTANDVVPVTATSP